MPYKRPTFGGHSGKAKQYNKARRGWTGHRAWRRLRESVLTERPYCEACDKRGELRVATDVDHKIPRAQRPDLKWERSNLQSLCKQCHSRKTRLEMR